MISHTATMTKSRRRMVITPTLVSALTGESEVRQPGNVPRSIEVPVEMEEESQSKSESLLLCSNQEISISSFEDQSVSSRQLVDDVLQVFATFGKENTVEEISKPLLDERSKSSSSNEQEAKSYRTTAKSKKSESKLRRQGMEWESMASSTQTKSTSSTRSKSQIAKAASTTTPKNQNENERGAKITTIANEQEREEGVKHSKGSNSLTTNWSPGHKKDDSDASTQPTKSNVTRRLSTSATNSNGKDNQTEQFELNVEDDVTKPCKEDKVETQRKEQGSKAERKTTITWATDLVMQSHKTGELTEWREPLKKTSLNYLADTQSDAISRDKKNEGLCDSIESDSFQPEFKNMAQLLLCDMQSNKLHTVQEAIYKLGALLEEDKGNARMAFGLGVDVILPLVMRKFLKDPEIQRWGCFCFSHLVRTKPEPAFAIIKSGGIAALVNAMRLLPDSYSVQTNGFLALENLMLDLEEQAPKEAEKTTRQFVDEYDGLRLIVKAMERFPSDTYLQSVTCEFCKFLVDKCDTKAMKKAGVVNAVAKAGVNHPVVEKLSWAFMNAYFTPQESRVRRQSTKEWFVGKCSKTSPWTRKSSKYFAEKRRFFPSVS